MTYITEKSEYTGDDVPLLDTETAVKGYDGTDIGPANSQAQVLANRTKWLKDKGDKTDEIITTLTDTTENIKLKQNTINDRLSKLSNTVADVDKNSADRDQSLETLINTQKKELSDSFTATLNHEVEKLDIREKHDVYVLTNKTDWLSSDIEDLTKGLGQATTDIADNKLAIKNLDTTVNDVKTTVDNVESTIDDIKTTVDNVKEAKQDKLKSGDNINTVFGRSLVDVTKEGITLGDAPDFADILKQHMGVGKGLSLDESEDGETLTLSVVKEENLGSNLTIKTMEGVRANQVVELKTKQRPNYNLRAFAFKAATIAKQSNLTVNFITSLDSNLVSPYVEPTGDSATNRICLVPDATNNIRWSSTDTLQFTTEYPDTHLAFSIDGTVWQTYSVDNQKWIDLPNLTVDEASAYSVVAQGLTIKQYNALSGSIIGNWLASAEDTPSLYLAFASPVSNAQQGFIPDHMSATFKAVSGWTLQSPYFVPVSITQDSIIFKPQNSGDYVFCFEFQK